MVSICSEAYALGFTGWRRKQTIRTIHTGVIMSQSMNTLESKIQFTSFPNQIPNLPSKLIQWTKMF